RAHGKVLMTSSFRARKYFLLAVLAFATPGAVALSCAPTLVYDFTKGGAAGAGGAGGAGGSTSSTGGRDGGHDAGPDGSDAGDASDGSDGCTTGSDSDPMN